ncbi:MAG: hypothetical protein Kow00124_01760 [Anaerolineae bacterium]
MADKSFQAAMREAADAAWDKDWPRAVEAYSQAVRANPNDPQALAGLALSLMGVGRYQEALQVYDRVSKLVPGDPLPHEKIAEIYERLGRRQEAARKHLAIGELYFARRDVKRAIPSWENAARLNPDLPQPHARLASVYEQDEKKHKLAVLALLYFARTMQQIGDTKHAEQALLRAQKLAPINPDVRDALATLKAGGVLERIESPEYPPPPSRPITRPLEALDDEEEVEEHEAPLAPVDDAIRASMGVLADMLFSGEAVPEKAQPLLLQALQAHQTGDVGTALHFYSQAQKARFEHPNLTLLIGMLQAVLGAHDDAFKTLSRFTPPPDYHIAAQLALGQLHLQMGRPAEAARTLVEALIEADRMFNQGQVDEGGYQRLLDNLAGQAPEQQAELARALAFYLDDPRWRTKLQDSLDGYAARDKISYVTDLIELILEGGRPEIAEVMQRIDSYTMRGMLTMAKEEAHYAIEYAPDYLPVHARLADILIKEGRLREAATKINLVATAYQMRGNEDKAADLFAQVIEIWPADMAARTKVIEMLKAQGRTVEALRQYADMGEACHRMLADTDKAVQVYTEAYEYGRRHQVDPQYVVPILKAMADIEMQHLNWQKALAHYLQVYQMAPDDGEAANEVVNLYFQLGDPVKAVHVLDTYLRYCLSHGDTARLVSTLERQVRNHPNEIALRQRLADVYVQQKRIAEAVAQLDALGELYLDAGRLEEAKTTIRRVIALNPPDVDGYQRLLQQLESSS